MSDMSCFVGIDVAKAQLDIALRPSGERWSVPNDTNGVTALVDRMQTLQPTLIVLEATGGLERMVTSALAHFADVIRPTPRPLPDTQTQELRALLGRRQQLIVMRTAEQNRLVGTSERLQTDIKAH